MNEFEHLPVGGVHTGAARWGGGAYDHSQSNMNLDQTKR